MKAVIIVKDGDIKKVWNVKGFIEMRIRKLFDKMNCQLVDDSNNTVIFHVKTKKEIFDSIKEELEVLYPGSFVYLQPKKTGTK